MKTCHSLLLVAMVAMVSWACSSVPTSPEETEMKNLGDAKVVDAPESTPAPSPAPTPAPAKKHKR